MDLKGFEKTGSPGLVRSILGRIQADGKIPFSEFMDQALYAPEEGYYTSPGEKIGGPQADYYTSSELHSLFGAMIARQMAELAPAVTQGDLTILEMGAGKGRLCRDILRYLRAEEPELYARLTYCIMERSPAMVQRQKAVLRPFVEEGKVRWTDLDEWLIRPESLTGFVLTNELLDSFSVHRVICHRGVLKEIYVTRDADGFCEVLAEPSSPELVAYFERLDITLEEGQQAEVNLEALDWMRNVGRILEKGMVMTFDFGFPADELYAPQRKRGTFLCYYKHRVTENPYVRIGLQDMTAHVDFTSLARTGLEAGLKVAGFTDQQSFLLGMGIAEEMDKDLARCSSPSDRERQVMAMKQLIGPDGIGKVLKVLIQHKQIEAPPLRGLTYRPFLKEL